jgi:hypothetical protein
MKSKGEWKDLDSPFLGCLFRLIEKPLSEKVTHCVLPCLQASRNSASCSAEVILGTILIPSLIFCHRNFLESDKKMERTISRDPLVFGTLDILDTSQMATVTYIVAAFAASDSRLRAVEALSQGPLYFTVIDFCKFTPSAQFFLFLSLFEGLWQS